MAVANLETMSRAVMEKMETVLTPRVSLPFLDASSHLYKRVCPSVGPSVGWLVAFFLIAKMKVFLHVCHQGGPGTTQKCRLASPLEGLTVGTSVHLRIREARTHLKI